MHTLTIGSTREVAASVSSSYALREVPFESIVTPKLYGPIDPYQFLPDYQFATARRALERLEGVQGIRIIIADYLRWRCSEPGEIADLWQRIWIKRDFHGCKVVWA